MTIFLTAEDVITLHRVRAPGAALIDAGKLDGAVNRPRQVEAYDETATIHTMAGVLLEGVITAHAFQDGNKRAGVLAVITFYQLNGYDLSISDTDLVYLAVEIAMGDCDAAKAADRLAACARPLPDPEG